MRDFAMTGRTSGRIGGLAILAALVLTACAGQGSRSLTLVGRNDGPNEFSLVPAKPLQQPQDLTVLPEPTPGGTNRTDRAPQAEAIAALGGDQGVLARPSPAADNALLAAATRFGMDENIRGELARDDIEYLQQPRGILRRRGISPGRYLDAYDFMALDQPTMHRRARQAGARTVGAQPMATSDGPVLAPLPPAGQQAAPSQQQGPAPGR